MSDRIPLDTVEAQFAFHLCTLDDATASQAARSIALKHLATAFLDERITSTRLAAELVTARSALVVSKAALAAARQVEQSMRSILLEAEQPAQTSVPSSPPRLTVVRES